MMYAQVESQVKSALEWLEREGDGFTWADAADEIEGAMTEAYRMAQPLRSSIQRR